MATQTEPASSTVEATPQAVGSNGEHQKATAPATPPEEVSNGTRIREVSIVGMNRAIEEQAVRQHEVGKIALLGPTGAGKTFTGLSLATELQGDRSILCIDTERKTARKYAHDRRCGGPDRCRDQGHFTFAHLPWDPPFDPAELAKVLREEYAHDRRGVIMIDSLTHFWRGEGGTLDVVDVKKKQNQGGNEFAAWKFGDQVQSDMVEALLACPCHLIVTMRVKMAYGTEERTRNGRTSTVPVKLGLQPIQRDALEYEFDVIGDMPLSHELVISKSRCSAIADKVYLPGHEREMARALGDWLEGGEAEYDVRATVGETEARDRVADALTAMTVQPRKMLLADIFGEVVVTARTIRECDREHLEQLIAGLRLPLDLDEAIPETQSPSTAGADQPTTSTERAASTEAEPASASEEAALPIGS